MKRKIKNIARFANQLTDAKPEFVSLVNHGANQTPFKTLKSAKIIADSDNIEVKENDMTKCKEKSKDKDKKDYTYSQAEIQKVSLIS